MLFRGMTVVVALAMLAACSSDPAPVEPDPSPTATASSTPTIAVPTMPAQAREDSPEGAAAFVKHYVDVFNYAAATGDVDELSELSSPDCEGCQKYIDEFRSIYARGDRITTHLWTLSSDPLRVGDKSLVTAGIDVDEGEVKRYRFNFMLARPDQFQIQRITFEDPA
ncbi:MAG: hypothetical protein JWR55_1035 [Aeromicrobium sp.]|nr:hypothetical protein [Aeromicrobium sp.]